MKKIFKFLSKSTTIAFVWFSAIYLSASNSKQLELINFFIDQPTEIEKLYDYILKLYPGLDIQHFDELNDVSINENFDVLVQFFKNLSNIQKQKSANNKEALARVELVIKNLSFEYLLQYTLCSILRESEFNEKIKKISEKFDQQFFNEFKNYFQEKLYDIKKIYPYKIVCVYIALYAFESALKKIK